MKKLNELHEIDPAMQEELSEFAKAVQMSADNAYKLDKPCIASALLAVHEDMEKWIKAYEDKAVAFDEAYEELTYLHVFSAIYLNPEKLRQTCDSQQATA
tara:strand:- start:100 stop:399 length:300 start_codon:yes stop_codon:yes gene_type:complete